MTGLGVLFDAGVFGILLGGLPSVAKDFIELRRQRCGASPVNVDLRFFYAAHIVLMVLLVLDLVQPGNTILKILFWVEFSICILTIILLLSRYFFATNVKRDFDIRG